MAESSLSVGRPELRLEVADYLGMGRASASWDADQVARIDSCVDAGLRKFYNPPALPGDLHTHKWTFLEPTATITTVASQTDYDLPDDYGAIRGKLTYDDLFGYPPITVCDESRIRQLRQQSQVNVFPYLAAIIPKPGFDGSNGQRFQITFWPDPLGGRVITYRYLRMPERVTSGNPYPVGGSFHAETLIEACLAAAEQRYKDRIGHHSELFMQRLKASVDFDNRANTPENFGYNGDGSDGQNRDIHRGHSDYITASF